MILCHCNVLSHEQIQSAIEHVGGAGAVTPNCIYKHLGCRPQCGQCRDHMMGLIDQHIEGHARGDGEPLFLAAAE